MGTAGSSWVLEAGSAPLILKCRRKPLWVESSVAPWATEPWLSARKEHFSVWPPPLGITAVARQLQCHATTAAAAAAEAQAPAALVVARPQQPWGRRPRPAKPLPAR